MFFAAFFGRYFSVIFIVLSKGDEQFRKEQFLNISYWLGLPDILLMYLPLPFFSMPRAPTVGTAMSIWRQVL